MTKAKEKLRINKDKSQIKSLFNNIKGGKAKILVWMMVGDKKMTAEATLKMIRDASSEIVVTPTVKGEENFGKIVVNKEKVNFYIPSEKILFQAKVKSVDDDLRMTLVFPEVITQVERRSHLRLFVEEDSDISINFVKGVGSQSRNQSFIKKCYDVSAGGLSVVVSRAEAKFFNTSDTILGAQLSIDGHIIYVDMEVVNNVKVSPDSQNNLFYAGAKIGLEFKEIEKADKDFIEQFVFNLIDIDEIIGF
jgi:c-di-GMP-binding flagellar brake protein YcgR